jgi:hypothetical protein
MFPCCAFSQFLNATYKTTRLAVANSHYAVSIFSFQCSTMDMLPNMFETVNHFLLRIVIFNRRKANKFFENAVIMHFLTVFIVIIDNEFFAMGDNET